MIIDVEKLVQENWEIERLGNNMRVSYVNKSRGSSPRPFILPRKIKVDKEFVEAIAMYLGDGKLSADMCHLDFTSKDKDMIKMVLRLFLDRFNLQVDGIRHTLTYRELKEDSIVGWSKYLGVPENLINLIQSNRHRAECFAMQIGGVILRTIFGSITEEVLKSEIYKDETLRRAFLRGLFAAEGNIAINRQTNYIVCMQFCLHINEDEIAHLVVKSLDLEGADYVIKKTETDKSMTIRFTGWRNYYKAWRMSLFDCSARKKQLFLDKVKRTKFFFGLKKDFIKRLLDSSGWTHRQICLKLGIDPVILCHLNTGRTQFINKENLLKLADFNNIPLEEVKKNIIALRVNRTTVLEDLGFVGVVFFCGASTTSSRNTCLRN